MADQQTAPLTDEERAELEALRAEKAAREQAERARRERAELEALRAEAKAAEQPAPASAPVAKPAPRADERPPVVDPDNLTFGQRMVMTPKTDDPDDIPGMPPAQKIIIAIVLLVAVGGGIWIALSNAGMV
ncbi:hypothetical protein [Collinsella tanakaei]|uniref:hypothetical protein n=1 Tax=Collinsella tanakaei TaxID=626935 RepID=UPI0025A37EF1|nr:hypothetical protein [Collinsella tanakaei]MDM8299629.1 hypothetical protein [Collinsella tanakaei]